MTLLLRKLCFGAAMIVASTASYALPITFEISDGSIDQAGLEIGDLDFSTTLSSGLAGHTFGLNEGETSALFDFFDVHVSGFGIIGGFLEATLNFIQPETSSASGDLFGLGGLFFVTAGGGLGVVDQPDAVVFGNGGIFDVNFYGFTDGCKIWNDGPCTSLSGTVQASVTLVKAPTAAVPEPGTVGLLGGGLFVLGLLGRRRASSR